MHFNNFFKGRHGKSRHTSIPGTKDRRHGARIRRGLWRFTAGCRRFKKTLIKLNTAPECSDTQIQFLQKAGIHKSNRLPQKCLKCKSNTKGKHISSSFDLRRTLSHERYEDVPMLHPKLPGEMMKVTF